MRIGVHHPIGRFPVAVVELLALRAADPELTGAVLHPGWVSTDMGGPGAPVKPGDSVAGMRRVIAGLKAKDSGAFFAFDGERLPW